MVRVIFGRFYGMPLRQVIFNMFILIIIWTVLADLFKWKLNKKILWHRVNQLLTVEMSVLICIATLYSRENTMDVCWIPFYSFKMARQQPEIYRSMLMNVFLFFPLGLTLPYALPEKWKHQAVIAILFALGLSVAIEFLQYYLCLGRAEMDDVICNTLGCAIGTIAFLLPDILKKNSKSK